jgi:hypothetical protein
MDKKTIIDTIVSETKEIDFSDALEYTEAIEAFVKFHVFEYELKSLIERYKPLHHKNTLNVQLSLREETFLDCLPYLCFVPVEILAKNDYLSAAIQKGKLSRFIIPLDELQQHMKESHKIGSYIISLPMLAIQVNTTIKWHFMNEFMTSLGLGREIFRFEQTTMGKKEITVVIKPINKMIKAFNDNMRHINTKLAKGESIVGDIQLGWFNVYDELRGIAKQLNSKEVVLEDVITNIGKVVQGLIPDELKPLTIFVVDKPSRSDTRRLYDQLFFFYQKMNPFDYAFVSLDKRLEGLGKDEKLIAKETSIYYELLGRKMRRYFGIEFIKIT